MVTGHPTSVHTDLRPNGVGVVHVSGEVDVVTCSALKEALASLITTGTPRIAVDCAEVAFLDSLAANVLIRAECDACARGGQLRVASLHGRPLRVFELLGLDEVIPVDRDIDQAVSVLAG